MDRTTELRERRRLRRWHNGGQNDRLHCEDIALRGTDPNAAILTTGGHDDRRESNCRHRRRRIAAFGGLVLAMFMFGGYFVAGRHGAVAGLTSQDLVALRYVLPGLVFVPLLLKWGTCGTSVESDGCEGQR